MDIIDWLKESIKYKGVQVPPAELEGLLLCHPKDRDAAVVGVYTGTAPVRYQCILSCWPKDERNESKEIEITEWLNTRLSHPN